MNKKSKNTSKENNTKNNSFTGLTVLEIGDIKTTVKVLEFLKNGVIDKKALLDGYADFFWARIMRERKSNEAAFLKEEMKFLKKEGKNFILKTTEEELFEYQITAAEVQEAAEKIIGRAKRKYGEYELFNQKL
jgi:hypothetical protein